MRRRVWGDNQAISGSDLSSIGSLLEAALGELGEGFGPGVLRGLQIQDTAPASSSIVVRAGSVLLSDAAAGRVRLALLRSDASISFAALNPGTYSLVANLTEAGEDTRTIQPPPLGNPFYNAALNPYTLDTVRVQTIALRAEPSGYVPTASETILASVTWSGNTVQANNISAILGRPGINIPDGWIQPTKLAATLAGSGIARGLGGDLNVNVDSETLDVNADILRVKDAGISDAKIGNRTLTPTTPSSNTGTLTELLSGIANRIQAIVGGSNWWSAPANSLNGLDAGFTTHATASVLDHPDGSVTDAKIGTRSADQNSTPNASLGTLTQFVSWFASRFKAVLGTASWLDAPPTTLQSAASHIANTAPHQATASATPDRLMLRDALGRAQVAAPNGPSDIARKAEVDVVGNQVVPLGGVIFWSGTAGAIPASFRACDGSALSRADFAALFQVVGTVFGPGNGSTTFNLPDMRDRFPVGAGATYQPGQTGGVNQVTLSTDQLPAHGHTGNTNNAGAHTHTGNTSTAAAHSHAVTLSNGGGHNHPGAAVGVDGQHAHYLVGSVGTGSSSAWAPYIIQVDGWDDFASWPSQGTQNGWATSPKNVVPNTADLGTAVPAIGSQHTHALTIPTDGAHTHTATVEQGGDHAHTFTTSSSGDHAHSFTTNNAGSGQPHENRPPYLGLFAIIRVQ